MKYLYYSFICLGLIAFQAQANDITGIWGTDEYQCPTGVLNTEKIKIEKNGSVFTAIKVIGDDCVPTGFVTFVWDSDTNNCQVFEGTSSNQASVISKCSISIVDDNNLILFPGSNISENKIKFSKISNAPMSTEVTPNLDIHIPSAIYESPDGLVNIWANLEYKNMDGDGDLIWNLDP